MQKGNVGCPGPEKDTDIIHWESDHSYGVLFATGHPQLALNSGEYLIIGVGKATPIA